MGYTRSRAIRHSSQRDFDQERADLNEGYQNYKAVTQSSIDEVVDSDKYSAEQKKGILNAYKADLMQQQENYRAELQRINDEEAKYRAEEGFDGSYILEEQDAADSYCNFSDQASQEVDSDAQDYCGTVDMDDDSEENAAGNDLSNGM